MRPFVSVVIPVYNAAPWLARAVQSALAQPETAEILIVEDGSTDGSLAQCELLARTHPTVTLLRHPDGGNHGAGASRNLGMRQARYDWIAFLDADDYYLPGRFSGLADLLVRLPEAEGVYGLARYDFASPEAAATYRAGRVVATLVGPTHSIAPEQLFEQLINGSGQWFTINTVVVQQSVIERVGYFDPTLRQAQDTDWLYRLSRAARLYPLDLVHPRAAIGIHTHNRVYNTREALHYRYVLLRRWSCVVLRGPYTSATRRYWLRACADTAWRLRAWPSWLRRAYKAGWWLRHLVSPGHLMAAGHSDRAQP